MFNNKADQQSGLRLVVWKYPLVQQGEMCQTNWHKVESSIWPDVAQLVQQQLEVRSVKPSGRCCFFLKGSGVVWQLYHHILWNCETVKGNWLKEEQMLELPEVSGLQVATRPLCSHRRHFSVTARRATSTLIGRSCCTVHCALCTVYCAQCTVQCAMYNVQHTLDRWACHFFAAIDAIWWMRKPWGGPSPHHL